MKENGVSRHIAPEILNSRNKRQKDSDKQQEQASVEIINLELWTPDFDNFEAQFSSISNFS